MAYKTAKRTILSLACFLLTAIVMQVPNISFGQTVATIEIKSGVSASFRGLSVVDDSVAWLGGTNGTVGVSVNGGRQWKWNKVLGCEKCDFRSIFAFDDRSAVIANAGTPAVIFITRDGGAHWKETYRLDDTNAFIDGITFTESGDGIAYGDPLTGRLLVLTSSDNGESWTTLPTDYRPEAQAGEASFAASGTCVHMFSNQHWIIATGGKVSSLLETKNSGRSWQHINTPILQGKSSTGIFSFYGLSKKNWLIVGGDYTQDTITTNNAFYTRNAGRKWLRPKVPPRGYRECISRATPGKNQSILTLGPRGIDISHSNGKTWLPYADDRQLHVVKHARKGTTTIAAGGNGKIVLIR
ncbi:MAG: oxidoreductase [Chitinophagaceae bacterium]|nr:oxidoreductase [Chitinophagaceae bacterium]